MRALGGMVLSTEDMGVMTDAAAIVDTVNIIANVL